MRFPEFTDEWEEERNDLIFDVISERNKNLKYDRILSASQSLGMVFRDELGIDMKFDKASISTYKIVKSGDYVIHLRSFQGGFAFSRKEGICSPAYTILRPNNKVSFSFFENGFTSKKFVDSLRIVTYGIRDGRSISVEEWLRLKSCFPSKAEQEKIIHFLDIINKRLATQTKLIEKLQSLMGGIIDGTLYKRKYRLNGYVSEWKLLKLGDLGVFVRGLSYDNNSVVDDCTKTLVIRSNNISQGKEVDLSKDVVYVDKIPEKEQMLQDNDIVFCLANGSSALVGKNSVYNGNYNGTITIGAFCGIYRGTSLLTRWLLNSAQYQRFISNLMQGGNGAIANLKGQDILKLSFEFPSECEEENRLSIILSSIEQKNVAEERLLKLYKSQKHYLLSQMFI